MSLLRMRFSRIGGFWRISGLAGVCGGVLLWAATGRARDTPQLVVALRYEIDPTVPGCPTETEFRAAVIRQVGYDPFRSQAPRHVLAQVQPSERGIDGQITWTDALGSKEGERRFVSPHRDCGELMKGVTFAVAVQIQLLNTSAGADDAEPERPTPPPAPTPAPPVDAGPPPIVDVPPPLRKEPPPPTRSIEVGFGPLAQLGWAPSPSAGGRVFAAMRWRALSVEVGAQATLPVKMRQADGTGFSASSLGATLAPCFHVGRLGLCAVGMISRMHVEGFGVDDTRSPSSALARAGLRLALDQPMSGPFALRAYAEGLAALTPRTVFLNDTPVWAVPSLGGAFGIDFRMLFR
jgi:hypothetical protein